MRVLASLLDTLIPSRRRKFDIVELADSIFAEFQDEMALRSSLCCASLGYQLCTEPVGHDGDHIAGGPDGEVYNRWRNSR